MPAGLPVDSLTSVIDISDYQCYVVTGADDLEVMAGVQSMTAGQSCAIRIDFLVESRMSPQCGSEYWCQR